MYTGAVVAGTFVLSRSATALTHTQHARTQHPHTSSHTAVYDSCCAELQTRTNSKPPDNKRCPEIKIFEDTPKTAKSINQTHVTQATASSGHHCYRHKKPVRWQPCTPAHWHPCGRQLRSPAGPPQVASC